MTTMKPKCYLFGRRGTETMTAVGRDMILLAVRLVKEGWAVTMSDAADAMAAAMDKGVIG